MNEHLDVHLRLLEYVSDRNLQVVQGLVSTLPRPNLEFCEERAGNTALHLAARAGYVEIVGCLINAGAKVDSTDNQLRTPLHLACRANNLPIVRLLVEHSDDPRSYVNTNDALDQNALFDAVDRGDEGVIRYLLAVGADPKQRNHYECTPAHDAALRNHSSMMQLLLDRDLSAIDDQAGDMLDQRTCLHMAAANNDADGVEWLLTHNANPSIKDTHGMTAWEVACSGKAQSGSASDNLGAISAFAYKELKADHNYPDMVKHVSKWWYHVRVYDVGDMNV